MITENCYSMEQEELSKHNGDPDELAKPSLSRIQDILIGPEMNVLVEKTTGQLSQDLHEYQQNALQALQAQEERFVEAIKQTEQNANNFVKNLSEEFNEKLRILQTDMRQRFEVMEESFSEYQKQQATLNNGLEKQTRKTRKMLNNFLSDYEGFEDQREEKILQAFGRLESEIEKFVLLQRRINNQVKEKLEIRQEDLNRMDDVFKE